MGSVGYYPLDRVIAVLRRRILFLLYGVAARILIFHSAL
jgi:hypothetical protein